MRAVWFVAIVACSTREAPIVRKNVDQLGEADRHVLMQTYGRVSNTRSHGGFSPAHLSFTLSHNGRAVTVVTKDFVPEKFRDKVDAVVEGRYVRADEVREALDKEGFREVSGDVFLARDVKVHLDFQF